MPNHLTKMMKRVGKLIPRPIRKRIKSSGKKVLKRLPSPINRAFGRAVKGKPRSSVPLDHLGLADNDINRFGKGTAHSITGRAAAGTALDEKSAARLHAAMLGHAAPQRSDVGGRLVSGVFGPDLRGDLVKEGYLVQPFVPGISIALAQKAEIIVVDLAGFSGVWGGALDPSGIGLFGEIYEALEKARARGVTCWLVKRGNQKHHHGAIALAGSTLVEVVVPGQPSVEQTHFTEDPGDAPGGIVEIIRGLEVTQ